MPTEYTGMASRDGTRTLSDAGEHCIECGALWPRGRKHDCPVTRTLPQRRKKAATLCAALARDLTALGFGCEIIATWESGGGERTAAHITTANPSREQEEPTRESD